METERLLSCGSRHKTIQMTKTMKTMCGTLVVLRAACCAATVSGGARCSLTALWQASTHHIQRFACSRRIGCRDDHWGVVTCFSVVHLAMGTTTSTQRAPRNDAGSRRRLLYSLALVLFMLVWGKYTY